MRSRWIVCVVLVATLVATSVAQTTSVQPTEPSVRDHLQRMAENLATSLFLVKLAVDAVDMPMQQWHLSQLESLLTGADEETAARFGWPRTVMPGLVDDARELAALLSRLPIDRQRRSEVVALAQNVQSLLGLAADEIATIRRQRPTALEREALLRTSAFLVAAFGLPINPYPGGLYSIAWRLGWSALLEDVRPLVNLTGEPPTR